MGRALKTLTQADIIEINSRLIKRFGGIYFEADQNLANPGSLDHILDAIQGSLFGVDLYPTVLEKAAAIAWRIIVGHVFHDGNKRTGMEACRVFLELNGYIMKIDRDVVIVAIQAAKREIDFTEFHKWVVARTTIY